MPVFLLLLLVTPLFADRVGRGVGFLPLRTSLLSGVYGFWVFILRLWFMEVKLLTLTFGVKSYSYVGNFKYPARKIR